MPLKNYLNKVVVLQKRVLRLIYIIGWKKHAIVSFVNTKILPITFLFHEAVCKLMLGVHNDNAPSNIIEIFARFSNNHIYTTRSEKSELFSVKLSRLKIQRGLFAC